MHVENNSTLPGVIKGQEGASGPVLTRRSGPQHLVKNKSVAKPKDKKSGVLIVSKPGPSTSVRGKASSPTSRVEPVEIPISTDIEPSGDGEKAITLKSKKEKEVLHLMRRYQTEMWNRFKEGNRNEDFLGISANFSPVEMELLERKLTLGLDGVDSCAEEDGSAAEDGYVHEERMLEGYPKGRSVPKDPQKWIVPHMA
ncbi:hypothetical protein RIF29_25848 [Crotalaria pallida]|uniref:Uncharacterized protein n=1 Tax=Crotalaria pallida TaxID=3830 RepID=A0AAN9I1D1_CROPI